MARPNGTTVVRGDWPGRISRGKRPTPRGKDSPGRNRKLERRTTATTFKRPNWFVRHHEKLNKKFRRLRKDLHTHVRRQELTVLNAFWTSEDKKEPRGVNWVSANCGVGALLTAWLLLRLYNKHELASTRSAHFFNIGPWEFAKFYIP